MVLGLASIIPTVATAHTQIRYQAKELTPGQMLLKLRHVRGR